MEPVEGEEAQGEIMQSMPNRPGASMSLIQERIFPNRDGFLCSWKPPFERFVPPQEQEQEQQDIGHIIPRQVTSPQSILSRTEANLNPLA